nr:unnamed protein product [Callosobruchus analis]
MKFVAYLLLSSLAVLEAGKLNKHHHGTLCPPDEVLRAHFCFDICEEFSCSDYQYHYFNKNILCIPRKVCSGREYQCICKEGYLRNLEGICVPRSECEFLSLISI